MSIPCIARILVVDNDPRVRRDLKEILGFSGHRVEAVEGVGPALLANAQDQAKKLRPHVVIMDLRSVDDADLGDRSGLDLLEQSVFSSARCILHSAYLQDFRITVEAFQKAGVDGVVGKQESPQCLLEAVEGSARKGCACRRGLRLEWPTAWNPQRVVDVLFGAGSDVPADIVNDVLGRLLSDAHVLTLQPLEGAAVSPLPMARGRSVLLRASPDDREPRVVKLAPEEKTIREVTAYEQYVKDRLRGLFHAHMQAHVTFWDVGGICYSFIGSSLNTIESFATFYARKKDPEAILKPLRQFFGEVWHMHYQTSRTQLEETLFDAYDRFLKLRHRLAQLPARDRKIRFTGLDAELPNPVHWVLHHQAESRVPTAYLAVTHGDLHGDNLFAEDDHAWAIDFERTGEGPILRDFVELEQDIITRIAVFPEQDWPLFYEFVKALCAPAFPDKPLRSTPRLRANPEARKAMKTIGLLRQLAREVTGYQDMREYYWGLLLDALVGSALSVKGSTTQQRGLLLAAVLCDRLEHWNTRPPPSGYPSLAKSVSASSTR